jgi:hypothetical protein
MPPRLAVAAASVPVALVIALGVLVLAVAFAVFPGLAPLMLLAAGAAVVERSITGRKWDR